MQGTGWKTGQPVREWSRTKSAGWPGDVNIGVAFLGMTTSAASAGIPHKFYPSSFRSPGMFVRKSEVSNVSINFYFNQTTAKSQMHGVF